MQQLNLAWIDHVHSVLPGSGSASDQRRLQLVLELSRRDTAVRPEDIPNLTGELAVRYLKRGPRTLPRDIKYLVDQGLLKPEGEGFRANKEAILAFLPIRKGPAAESAPGAMPPVG
jgi:hypothetical protein